MSLMEDVSRRPHPQSRNAASGRTHQRSHPPLAQIPRLRPLWPLARSRPHAPRSLLLEPADISRVRIRIGEDFAIGVQRRSLLDRGGYNEVWRLCGGRSGSAAWSKAVRTLRQFWIFPMSEACRTRQTGMSRGRLCLKKGTGTSPRYKFVEGSNHGLGASPRFEAKPPWQSSAPAAERAGRGTGQGQSARVWFPSRPLAVFRKTVSSMTSMANSRGICPFRRVIYVSSMSSMRRNASYAAGSARARMSESDRLHGRLQSEQRLSARFAIGERAAHGSIRGLTPRGSPDVGASGAALEFGLHAL